MPRLVLGSSVLMGGLMVNKCRFGVCFTFKACCRLLCDAIFANWNSVQQQLCVCLFLSGSTSVPIFSDYAFRLSSVICALRTGLMGGRFALIRVESCATSLGKCVTFVKR